MTELEDLLRFDPAEIDPGLSTGLWFCDDVTDVYTLKTNLVCLAEGAKPADLRPFADFFSAFTFLVIAVVDRARREALEEGLRAALPQCGIVSVKPEAFKGCQSLGGYVALYGSKDKLLMQVNELPAYGLLDISEVRTLPPGGRPVTTTGIPELDRAVGGFALGDLSVWTGRRGEGKSTLLSQVLLNAIDSGFRVCAYSGELPAWRFKEWLYLQAAGPWNLRKQRDKVSGRDWWSCPEHVIQAIDDWTRKNFFLYDLGITSAHDEDNILTVFEYAARRYGCNVFLVDNIMTARFRGGERDFYRAQSAFVGRLVQFAKTFKVHVHLVAHPRKGEGKEITADDVGGIADITNRADNVLSVFRAGPDEEGYDGGIALLKCRATGERVKLLLNYEPVSHRFFRGEDPKRVYGWERATQVLLETDEKTPFEE